MACSAYLLAKRALISVILALARIYKLEPDVNRESEDAQVTRAYRRLLLKVDCAGQVARPQPSREVLVLASAPASCIGSQGLEAETGPIGEDCLCSQGAVSVPFSESPDCGQ